MPINIDVDKTQVLVFICGIIYFIFCGIGHVTTGVITLNAAEDLGCSPGVISFWGGIQLAIMKTTGPFSTIPLQRFGMKWFGFIMGVVTFLFSLQLSIVKDVYMLGLALCLQGASVGVFYTGPLTISPQVFGARNSQVNVVFLNASIVGSAFAPLIQILMDEYGWRGAMAIVAAFHLNISVCSLLLNSKIGKVQSVLVTLDTQSYDSLEDNTECWNKLLEKLKLNVFNKNPKLISVFLYGLCMGSISSIFYLLIIPYAEEHSMSPFDASTLKLYPFIPCILIRCCIFYLGDISIKTQVNLLLLAQVFGVTAFMLYVFWPISSMFYLGSTFLGTTMGIQFPVSFSLASKCVHKGEDIPFAVSWTVFAVGLGSVCVALLALNTTNYQDAFVVGFFIQIIAILFVVYLIFKLQYEDSYLAM